MEYEDDSKPEVPFGALEVLTGVHNTPN